MPIYIKRQIIEVLSEDDFIAKLSVQKPPVAIKNVNDNNLFFQHWIKKEKVYKVGFNIHKASLQLVN